MLKTLENKLSANNLTLVSKSIISWDGKGSKINRVKSKVKYSNRKNRKTIKSKILIRSESHNFSSKSKKIKLSAFKLSFFIPKANLAFIKLR